MSEKKTTGKVVLNVLEAGIHVESDLPAAEVAKRIAGRLFPGGEKAEWEELDRDEHTAIGLMGYGGFSLELYGDPVTAFVYQTDCRIYDYMEKLGIEFETVRVDIEYQILWALEGLPGVKTFTKAYGVAKREAGLTDEDRFWMSAEGSLERMRQRFMESARLDQWERLPQYAEWEQLGYERRVELMKLFTDQMKDPSMEEMGAFFSKMTGLPAERIPLFDYM